MKTQSSYLDKKATLYLVPTPLGNFDDMTYRAVKVLKNVDCIYCEDTRVTKVLLSHFQISTPLRSYHLFNENLKSEEIIKLLKMGQDVALVSDAGMPCISDPGYLITRMALEYDFFVTSLPGASAGLTALISSGIPCDKFYFHGFLNSRKTARIKELKMVQDYQMTLVFYEAPHRLQNALLDIYQIMGNRKIVIARELTKKFEEYMRGTVKEVIDHNITYKGEIVIIIEGSHLKKEIDMLNSLTVEEHYNHYLKHFTDKEAIKKVASDRKLAKNEIYQCLKVKH